MYNWIEESFLSRHADDEQQRAENLCELLYDRPIREAPSIMKNMRLNHIRFSFLNSFLNWV